MRSRQIAEKLSWPLCLTFILAFVLLRQWYLGTGLLTFGDFLPPDVQAAASNAFHLWSFSDELGRAEPESWWQNAALQILFVLHAGAPATERIAWLCFPPVLYILGLYALATTLTKDAVAAGVAAFAAFFNVDFLVRTIGGHDASIMAIALAPWMLFAAVQTIRTANYTWLSLIVVTASVATAYDARWSIPAFVILAVFAACAFFSVPRRRAACLFAIFAAALGLIIPNLPWLVASLGAAQSISPMPSADYTNIIWVQRLSLASLTDAFVVWNPTFGSNFSGGPLVIKHVPDWGVVFFGLCVVSAILSRRLAALFFFAAFLVGTFLYKGLNGPGGGLYGWAFQHIPLFDLYREPLKFGAAASLCAAVVLAFGVSSARSLLLKTLFAAAICATALALAWPAFIKQGMLVSRKPDPVYARVRSVFREDPTASRVLWLPQRSRWLTNAGAHPVVDATWLGRRDWLVFLAQTGNDADPTDYINSPIFEQLLRWTGFRYVGVDCNTESDATYRSATYACARILSIIKARRFFQLILSAGGVSLFRLMGDSASPLWSAAQAVEADGPPLSWNAGALTGVFSHSAPILTADSGLSLPVVQTIAFDGATRSGTLRDANIERVVGADSVDFGTNAGDAVIHQSLRAIGLRLRQVTKRESTIAYAGALSGTEPNYARALAPFTLGTVLSMRALPLYRSMSAHHSIGFETPATAIPIYDHPALRIIADHSNATGRLQVLFDLHEPSGKRFTLVGPSFLQNNPPRYDLDIRDWLFRTIIANRSEDHAIGVNDGFDALDLVRARLVQWPGVRAGQRFSLTLRAVMPSNGYAVRAVQLFSASHYACMCRSSNGVQLQHALKIIKADPKLYSPFLVRQIAGETRGLVIAGNAPYWIVQSRGAAIVPAKDVALIDLHASGVDSGVLLVSGEVEKHATPWIVLRVKEKHGFGWILQSLNVAASANKMRAFRARVDLFSTVGLAGFRKLDDAMLIVASNDGRSLPPFKTKLDNALIVSDRAGAAPPSRLFVSSRRVSSNLTAGTVPVAARFSKRTPAAPRVVRFAISPSERIHFTDRSGNRWLVLSQRFDPGWALRAAGAAAPRALHFPAYGLLNAWFIPAGLHGTYEIVFVPADFARWGSWAALVLFCLSALVPLTLARKIRMG